MTNILTAPEAFDSGTWVKTTSTANANATTAPDGTATADRCLDNSGGGTGNVIFTQSKTVTISTAHTLSVFGKADQLSWVRFRDAGTANATCFFNLSTGAIGTQGAAVSDASVATFDDGWFRCSMVFTSGSSTASVSFLVSDNDNDVTVDLDGTSSIFLWGAYLNEGTTAETYVSQAGITVGSTPRIIRDVTRDITRNVTKNLIDF